MPKYKISIVIDDNGITDKLAKQIVEDTEDGDSMCLTLVNGDEIEFGIVSIEYEEVVG